MHLARHQLMREIRRRARALARRVAFLHDAPALLGKFVDEARMIGASVGALLMRASDITVRLAGKKIKPVDEIVETSAGEGVDVVDREISVTRKRPEDALHIALRDQ